MIDNKKEQERAELHRTIWGIANDLRGSVDGWDFKNYVLVMLFYRYISENLTNYINAGEAEAGTPDFDYTQLSDDEAEAAREDMVNTKGFFILPSELFCNVLAKADTDENLNETIERVFNNIENSAQGCDSEDDFRGLFDDFDVNSNKLGGTVAKRNERLVSLMNGVASMQLGDYKDNTIDAFGDAYEFLMGMYASNAGKSGGEYFTPQEVSELLTRLAVVGKTEVNKVYEDKKGKHVDGYVDMIDKLLTKFPLDEPQIVGEANQKEFISLIGAILRMRNLLVSFDEFEGNELISERDFQDYLGRYQDLHDEWKTRREKAKLENIDDDIVFEIELIKQIEINIDYILMLVAKYHDSHCMDKEVLITIQKAVDSSPELRSKKDLIENFIAGINEVEDVMDEWHSYVADEREKALQNIIDEEKLKAAETRQFIEGAFRDGTVKTTGTDIDKILPAVSRFGGGNRKEKKETVIEKLKRFFERFWNVG